MLVPGYCRPLLLLLAHCRDGRCRQQDKRSRADDAFAVKTTARDRDWEFFSTYKTSEPALFGQITRRCCRCTVGAALPAAFARTSDGRRLCRVVWLKPARRGGGPGGGPSAGGGGSLGY